MTAPAVPPGSAPPINAPLLGRRAHGRVPIVSRRIAARLGLSGLVHLALLLVVLLVATRRPTDEGAISPPSYQMVLEPGRPASLPASPPPAPPAPAEPAATVPPAPAQVRIALAPPAAPSAVPEPDAEPLPEPLPQNSPAPAGPPVPAAAPVAPVQRNVPPSRSRARIGIDLTFNPAAVDALGAAPRELAAPEGMIHVRGGYAAKEWIARLHEWWLQHSYYPDEAVQRQQSGSVQIHVKVDRSGRVSLVERVATSGSQWLDAGAQAVFRGATVPAFPPTTTEADTDLDITVDYVLTRR